MADDPAEAYDYDRWIEEVRETLKPAPSFRDPAFIAEMNRLGAALDKQFHSAKEKPARRRVPKIPPGDPRHLAGKESVTRARAENYLGLAAETVEKLIRGMQLESDGPNVTTASLREYWRNKKRGNQWRGNNPQ